VGLSPDQSQKTCPLFPMQQNVGVGRCLQNWHIAWIRDRPHGSGTG